MKRITMILLAALTFTFLIYAKSRTTNPIAAGTPVTQAPSKPTLTQTARDEYIKLAKSKAAESSVRSWAQRHSLEIVSLKGYDILVIPKLPPQNQPPQEASNCDHTKCPTAEGNYQLTNTKGELVGWQTVTCKAGACNWVKDSQGRWTRVCGKWNCTNGSKLPQ